MNFLRVIKPGFLTSVQDLGRRGFAGEGVSEAGAADSYSLRLGNLLVGNPQNAAGLEMTLVGGKFEIQASTLISITGSDFQPKLGGKEIPMWEAIAVKEGEILSFDATRSGARCYLCVAGGIDVPTLMGSRSTHLLTKLGGLDGRPLRGGDVLHSFEPPPGFEAMAGKKVCDLVMPKYEPAVTLRVILGPEDDHFVKESIDTFLSSEYTVSESSDRVGVRLLGSELRHLHGADILSEGVSVGAVQVPASGQPIILFVERPTTGGYAKIATVIGADLHQVGQLKPRDRIRFQQVSLEEAVELLHTQEKLLSPESLV